MNKYKVKEVNKMLKEDGWIEMYPKEITVSSSILQRKER